MVNRTILFSCDHKGCNIGHMFPIEYSSFDDARRDGWAISRDRKHCYCPRCAFHHRNVGCHGVVDLLW